MKITIYQDTYCPWCYVGKSNLEKAINKFDGGEVEVEYKSFFLNPNIPEDGMDKEEYIDEKYDKKQFRDMEKHLEEKAEKAGIEMQFSDEQRIPNTMLSHRLGKLYPNYKSKLIQKYYEAYFEENKDIGDIKILMEIANKVGIDPEEAKYKLMETDEKEDEVMDDYKEAIQIGVRGVPFFVFNNEQALQGAHEPEMFLQVMNRISARENIQFDIVNQ